MAALVGYVDFQSPIEAELRWRAGEDAPPLVTIERSEAPHDGFEVIAENVDSSLGVWYDTFDEPNENRFMYYRVGGTLLHIGDIPYQPAKEIIRRDRWFLNSRRRHSGAERVSVFIRRTSGPRCSECYDPHLERVTKTKCDVCYGTGMENPFFRKIEMDVSNFIAQRTRRPQEDRIAQWHETQVWSSNFPLLKPGDVMVRNSWPWRVEHVQFTRVGKVITKQMITLKRFESYRDVHRYPFLRPYKTAFLRLRARSFLTLDDLVL